MSFVLNHELQTPELKRDVYRYLLIREKFISPRIMQACKGFKPSKNNSSSFGLLIHIHPGGMVTQRKFNLHENEF